MVHEAVQKVKAQEYDDVSSLAWPGIMIVRRESLGRSGIETKEWGRGRGEGQQNGGERGKNQSDIR